MSEEKPKFTFAYAMELAAAKESVDAHTEKIMPSTMKNVDGMPSTMKKSAVMPSTCTNKAEPIAVMPPTKENVDGNKGKNKPSTIRDRHKTGRVRFDNRINAGIAQQIKEFCARYNFTQQDFTEQAAVHFIEKFENLPSTNFDNVDGMPSLNNIKMKLWKTTPAIISLYCKFTPNKTFENWHSGDDKIAQKFNEVDLNFVEYGILLTLLRTKGKKTINSFTYYQGAIEECLNADPNAEMLAMLVEHHRKLYEMQIKSNRVR